MKTFVIAAAAAALAGIGAPALAQTMSQPQPQAYAGNGYTGLSPNGHDAGEVTGRLGGKMGRYWGVEAELGTGVNSTTYASPGGRTSLSEQPSGAGYIVGYVPITPRFELLARVGGGDTQFKYETPTGTTQVVSGSFNYGAGGQYFFDDKNGLRADYTRRDFQGSTAPRDMDTWSVGYVRKF